MSSDTPAAHETINREREEHRETVTRSYWHVDADVAGGVAREFQLPLLDLAGEPDRSGRRAF